MLRAINAEAGLVVKTAFPQIRLAIGLERSSSVPLFRQLYLSLREEIVSWHLPPGARLPPSRALASHLSIARNTVINAYEQLLAEGYLESRVGSGTRVAEEIPIEESGAFPLVRSLLSGPEPSPQQTPPGPGIFAIDRPAYDAFPFETMRRLITNRMRDDFPGVLDNHDPAGLLQLRQAIARYVSNERGIKCAASEIFITAGSLHGVDIIGRALRLAGARVCIEDPTDIATRQNLIAAGAKLVPVRVDQDGCDVEQLSRRGTNVRLVCITPSNQYPLGGAMSLSRRLKLLEWSAKTGAMILEDDADSEFRYATRPLAPLKTLDRRETVIYAATFSRILHPNLRLGYLIVPRRLVEAVLRVRENTDRHPPLLEQTMASEFIARGHFAIHIRRMRKLYRDRQHGLVAALRRHLPPGVDARPAGPGLNTLVELPPGTNDEAIVRSAAHEGIHLHALSRHYLTSRKRSGILLGNTSSSANEINAAVRRISTIIAREI